MRACHEFNSESGRVCKDLVNPPLQWVGGTPNVTSTQELYDKLWSDGIQRGHADFGDLDMTLRFLDLVQSPRSSDAVLEIGCGTGALCEALRARGCLNL